MGSNCGQKKCQNGTKDGYYQSPVSVGQGVAGAVSESQNETKGG